MKYLVFVFHVAINCCYSYELTGLVFIEYIGAVRNKVRSEYTIDIYPASYNHYGR